MIEYVLILTLVGYSSQSGQSIEHIPGFHLKAECLTAGNEWLRQVRAEPAYAGRYAKAICITRTTQGKEVKS